VALENDNKADMPFVGAQTVTNRSLLMMPCDAVIRFHTPI
jgi:DUF1009 family protein